MDAGRSLARSRWLLAELSARALRTMATSARSPPPGSVRSEYLARSSAAPILVSAARGAGASRADSATRQASARGDSLGCPDCP